MEKQRIQAVISVAKAVRFYRFKMLYVHGSLILK